MEKKDWMVMMEHMQDIRRFCSLMVQRKHKGSISSAQELDLLSRIALTEEKMTPMEISRRMGVSKSLVSRLIEDLAGKGLLCRQQDLKDKRSYYAAITIKGQKELDDTYGDYLKPVYQLRAQLGEAEFEEFTGMIRRVNEKLKEI